MSHVSLGAWRPWQWLLRLGAGQSEVQAWQAQRPEELSPEAIVTVTSQEGRSIHSFQEIAAPWPPHLPKAHLFAPSHWGLGSRADLGGGHNS